MKERILANVDDFEGNIVNDDDEEGQKASDTPTVVAAARFAVTLNRPSQGDEDFLLFDETVTAMGFSGNWNDAMPRPLIRRCLCLFKGETSASASTSTSTAVEDCDLHNLHHKRAKVYSTSQ